MRTFLKRFFAMLMAVLMVTAVLPSYAFAAGDPPGTKQKLTVEDIGGVYELYHSVESGHQLYLYCFNSDMHWPRSSPTFASDYYVPEDMSHLSAAVKDKLYRIYYAGYPHNNVGLYTEKEAKKDHSMEELDLAVEPPPEIKALMKGEDWDNLHFSVETVLSNGREAWIMHQLSRYIGIDDRSDYIAAAMEKPSFYYAVLAYMYENEQADAFLKMYSSVYESMSPSVYDPGAAHDATQIAIWRILYENKVPHNSESFDEMMKSNPLIKELVDFANGKGDHADAYIPERGSTLKDLENCRKTFESGESLERADGTPVGKGTITFREQPNGHYESEPLRFLKELHTIPYTIELVDADGTVISSQINYGFGWIVFTVPAALKSAKVVVKTNHTLPSDTYHYAKESEASLPPEKLSEDNYQHMGGCYFESLPMRLELATEFLELPKTGSLKVKKTVDGNAGSKTKAFEFKVELEDKSLNGSYGDMTFTDGVASFTLKAGETRTAEGLPNGVRYTVTEADYTADGYVTTKSGDTGTIIGDDVLTASFTNTRNDEVPKTGDDSHLLFWLALFVTCGTALLLILTHNGKKKAGQKVI